MTSFICSEHGEMNKAIRREGYYAVDEAECVIEDGVLVIDLETNDTTSGEVTEVAYECPICGTVMQEPVNENGMSLEWEWA